MRNDVWILCLYNDSLLFITVILESDKQKHEHLNRIVKKYGIVLSEQHINALSYIHGEGDTHNSETRVMNELCAYCHMCDVWSARGWYDVSFRQILD